MTASEYGPLLKTLSEGYTITAACTKAGVSRMFYNRHYRSNPAFRKKADAARHLGKQTTDDRVTSAFLKKISDGDSRLIKYYLEHNVAPYKKTPEQSEPVSIRPTPERLTDAEAYEQFIVWSASTPDERIERGMKTREQFCKTYGIPKVRLLDEWAQRHDFEGRVAALREERIISKTGELLDEIYAAARDGDFKSRRLWLDYAKRIEEKRDSDGPKQDLFSSDDIRYLIGTLPEGLQGRNYSRLQSIKDDLVLYQRELERKEREKAEIEDRAKQEAILEYFKKPNGDIDWEAYANSL